MHLRGFVVVGCIKKNPSVFRADRQWMSFDGLQTDRQTGFITLCALGIFVATYVRSFSSRQTAKIRVSGLLNTNLAFALGAS
jgi:hypothetical protein